MQRERKGECAKLPFSKESHDWIYGRKTLKNRPERNQTLPQQQQAECVILLVVHRKFQICVDLHIPNYDKQKSAKITIYEKRPSGENICLRGFLGWKLNELYSGWGQRIENYICPN